MIIAPIKGGGVVITSIGHHNIRDNLKYKTDNVLRVQPLYTCMTFTLSPLSGEQYMRCSPPCIVTLILGQASV